MKFISVLFFLLIGSTSLLFSQDNASKLPASTFFAFSIDGGNLQEKMSLDQFQQLDFFKELKQELEREGLSGNLDEMGVDMDKELTMFATMEGDYIMMGMIVPISDVSIMEKLTDLNSIESANGIKSQSAYGLFRGTSANQLVISSVQVALPYPAWDASDQDKEPYEKASENRENVLNQFSLGLFNDNSNSLASVKKYKKGYDSNADANLFFSLTPDFASYYSGMMSQGMMGLMGASNSFLDQFTTDTYITSQLNFEGDKISLDTEYFMSSENMKSQKSMAKSKLNPELVKYISNDDLIGVYSLNLNMQSVLETYPNSAAPLLDMALPMISNAGNKVSSLISMVIDEEALGELINGNGLVSVSNFSPKEITYMTYDYDDDFNMIEKEETKTENLPDFLGIMSTSNPQAINNILELSSIESPLEMHDGYFMLPQDNEIIFPIYLFTHNNAFFTSNSKKQMEMIRSGKGYNNISPVLAKDMLKNTQHMQVNLATIFSNIEGPSNPERFEAKALAYLGSNTSTIKVKQFKPSGKSIKSTMEINVPGNSTSSNSLLYLFNTINDLYKLAQN